ncbi:MAG: hypothetical protein OHK0041_12280 [Anaerolineales bacterium]
MADPTPVPSPSREASGADDVLFQEAVDALRGGNKARARELLTGLLKDNQTNPEYWTWLSAAMETPKERMYCLQTALKLDPAHVAAKRGLILLGALPPDESVQPFSMPRTRAWEETLLLAHERPKPKGWEAVRSSPVFRLGLVILLIGAIAGGVVFGLILPNSTPATSIALPTAGPVLTFTPTPTAIGGKPQAAATARGPAQPDIPYTPTPLYVTMERSPLTADYLLQFENAYKQGNWDQAISALEEVLKLDPNLIAAYYYLGESYRFKGDVIRAQQYYNEALTRQPEFAPAYVGLARAQLVMNPGANVLPLLDQAVRNAPDFGEAYLERAQVKIRDNDLVGAVADLQKADQLLPGSPLVYYHLARAWLKQGDASLALEIARQALQRDVTSLPTYLLLGQIHAALGNYDDAVQFYSAYLQYEPRDLAAYIELGKLQFNNGNYADALRSMNEVLRTDPNRREAILYRFLSNVELGDAAAANADIARVRSSYPDLFEANLGIVRAELLNGRAGSAFLALEKTLALAADDKQKALAYYWAATVHERREEPRKAAEYWALLLDLPEDSMTPAMREEAQKKLASLRTPTPVSSPTRTPTPNRTVTAAPTRTPTPISPTASPTHTPPP